MSTRLVNRRPNGHDTAHPGVNEADDPTCSYCGQKINGDPGEILARIENTERTRLSRLETALRQQFSREQQRAVAKAKTDAEKARKEGAAVAEKKLALMRNQQATVVAAERETGAKKLTEAVNAERLQHATERLRLETALADALRRLQARTPHQLGEPAEIDLYEGLLAAFPGDRISRIVKGVRGPDVLVEVVHHDVVVGRIVLDSKNHAKWSSKFTTKLRADQLAEGGDGGADFGILSSSVMPKDARSVRLHIQDGIIVADPSLVVPLVHILRRQIIDNHRLKLTASARDERAGALLAYLTSKQADDLLEALRTTTDSLIAVEVAEVNDHRTRWRKRGELLRTLQKGHEDLVAAFDTILSGADPLPKEVTE